jgi:hypothetical protein
MCFNCRILLTIGYSLNKVPYSSMNHDDPSRSSYDDAGDIRYCLRGTHFAEVGDGDDEEWQGHLGNSRSGVGIVLKVRTMAKVGSPCASSLHRQSLSPQDATYLTWSTRNHGLRDLPTATYPDREVGIRKLLHRFTLRTHLIAWTS